MPPAKKGATSPAEQVLEPVADPDDFELFSTASAAILKLLPSRCSLQAALSEFVVADPDAAVNVQAITDWGYRVFDLYARAPPPADWLSSREAATDWPRSSGSSAPTALASGVRLLSILPRAESLNEQADRCYKTMSHISEDQHRFLGWVGRVAHLAAARPPLHLR